MFHCSISLQYISDYLKSDKGFILDILEYITNGVSLKYISNELKKDKDIVLKAITNTACAFQYVSYELRYDIEFILSAIKINPHVLMFIPEELINNKTFMLKAIYTDITALYYSNKLRGNQQFILDVVSKKGDALK